MKDFTGVEFLFEQEQNLFDQLIRQEVNEPREIKLNQGRTVKSQSEEVNEKKFVLLGPTNQDSALENNNQFLIPGLENPPTKNSVQSLDSMASKDDHNQQIFKEKTLRFCKNNNFPKLLIKKVLKGYNFYKRKYFQTQPNLSKQMDHFVKKEKGMYKKDRNWNNNLQAMRKFFGLNPEFDDPSLRSKLIREMSQQIIRSEIIPELKENGHITKLKSYLFTCKVQIFRCQNSELMGRVESH